MSEGPPDQWAARCGLALALQKLSPLLPEKEIETIFEFFVKKALGDRSEQVRKHMLDAAVAVVNDHGKVSGKSLEDHFKVTSRSLQGQSANCLFIDRHVFTYDAVLSSSGKRGDIVASI